jgi:hypothetical protein
MLSVHVSYIKLCYNYVIIHMYLTYVFVAL